MSEHPVDKYDDHAAWSDGTEQCPICGESLWPPVEPIKTSDGRRYDDPLATKPGMKWYHPECWEVLDTRRKADENESLDAFVGGGA